MSQIDFINNEMAQDAVIRNIEIIGEATKKISKDLKDNYFEIPWKLMAGTQLGHPVFGFSWESLVIENNGYSVY